MLWNPDPLEVVRMCHDWRMRRDMRREEHFDEELRYLIDEREISEPPAPVVDHDRDGEPTDPERVRVEAGSRV